MVDDWVLVLALEVVTVIVVSAFWVLYGAQRVYDVRRDCAKQIERLNQEKAEQRAMLDNAEMQMRTLGAVPVSRLIGEDSTP